MPTLVDSDPEITQDDYRNDIFTNSFHGLTIAPRNPTSPFDEQDFLDTLKQNGTRSRSLNWIKSDAAWWTYAALFDSAKSQLQRNALRSTIATLDSVLSNAVADTASVLTSEAYALIYYNTQYLLTQLPPPPPQYTLTIVDSGNGTVSRSPDLSQYDSSTTVSVSATPQTGWLFNRWIGDVTDTLNPVAVVMNTNKQITAVFVLSTYAIHASAGSHGAISPSGDVNVNYGGSQTFSATPDTGYHVDSLFVDGINQGPLGSYAFTNVIASHSIRAVFAINQYTITPTTGTNGSISPSTVVTVNYGGSQAFTITPNSCYHIDSVFVDDVNQGALSSHTFTSVRENHTIRAVFRINTYTLTPTAGSNGTISPSTVATVNCGSNQTFTISANSCYRIDSVFIDGVNQGAISSYTFSSVSANHTIRTVYRLNTYTITASSGSNGSISPTGTTTLNCGSSQSYTISPSTGYHVDSLIVDGANQGQLTSFTFTNVTANHTIRAVFAINSYTLTIQIQGSGTVTKTPDQSTYTHGSTVSLKAIGQGLERPVKPLSTGTRFDHWEIDASGSANPLTVTMDRNKTIKAVFVNY